MIVGRFVSEVISANAKKSDAPGNWSIAQIHLLN